MAGSNPEEGEVVLRQTLKKLPQYDWRNSNLALFGSDLHIATKIQASEYEPVWWDCEKTEGLKIWRIVNFQVTTWPEEQHGEFYDGDSYIILNTHANKDKCDIMHDVHFWIGKYSTQDEYGTAAYKTVELCDYLEKPTIQHREVQGHESEAFKNYFDSITYLKGGADSGFRQVLPEQYKPRLLHFHGDKKKVHVDEIPRNKMILDESDVYILDLGLMLYQWNGDYSNKDERQRAMQYLLALKDTRGGKCVSAVIDQHATEDDHEFYCYLDELSTVDEDEQSFRASDCCKELYRLSDHTGDLSFSLEKKGSVTLKDFDGNDVFIFDTKEEVFVWIGNGTTVVERRNAMTYAHTYLQQTDHPLVPISCMLEDAIENAASFIQAMAA